MCAWGWVASDYIYIYPTRFKGLYASSEATAGSLRANRSTPPPAGRGGPVLFRPGRTSQERYTAAVTLAIPVLLALIGIALIVGRRHPVMLIAGIFLIIGFYMGETVVGIHIVTGLNDLARVIR